MGIVSSFPSLSSSSEGRFLLYKVSYIFPHNCPCRSWRGLFFIAKIKAGGGDMYIEYLNNPTGRRVGDCSVRAVSKALGSTWEGAFIMLVINGLQMGDVMSSNEVIGATLRQNGFRKAAVPNTCPDCFTVKEFAELNPTGTYVLGTGDHVVCVDGGDYYDTWDSGDQVPLYVWYEKVNPRFERS